MAYNIEYYYQFYDLGDNLHKVELLLNDYSGGETSIDYAAQEPVQLSSKGANKDTFDNVIIQPQQLIFAFHVHRDDIDTFDSIFESNYKDYKVRYYIAGQLEFEGYVKPESLSRDFFKNPPYIEFKLTATDSLTDLKDTEFIPDNNNLVFSSPIILLTAIKEAVSSLGIDLDFMIQLGTYETSGMASNECALAVIEANARRFVKGLNISTTLQRKGFLGIGRTKVTEVGVTEYLSCWDVIEILLKPFNCKFKQYKGKYYITNYHEGDSYVFEFDYATLTEQGRTATDNIIDLSTYDFDEIGTLQKVRPLNAVEIVLKNKDMGGDITGQDLTDWAGNWDVSSWDSNSVDGDEITLNESTGWSDENDDLMVLNSAFAVTKVTDDDYIKIALTIISVTTTAPLNMFMTVLRPDNASYERTRPHSVRFGLQHRESYLTRQFNVLKSGDYNIKISFEPANKQAGATFSVVIRDVTVTKVVGGADADEIIVFDKGYRLESGVGFDIMKTDFLIGDGGEETELAALLYTDSTGLNTTAAWNSYGNTEGLKLINIFAQNTLNNRYSYKNYLKLKIIDRENTIGFNNILDINSRNYLFLSFTRVGRPGELECELIELLTTGQSYNDISETNLNSINGETVQSSSVASGTSDVVGDFLLNSGDTATGDYNFDSGTFFIDSSNDRVGIGTDSPVGILEVKDWVSLRTGGVVGNGKQYLFMDESAWSTANSGASINEANNFHYFDSGEVRIEFESSDDLMQFYIEAGTGYDAWYGLQEGSTHHWSFGYDSNQSGDLKFCTGFGIIPSTCKFVIEKGGNVGVGLSNAEAPFHLYRSSGEVYQRIETDGLSNAYLQFVTDGDGTERGARIGVDYSDSVLRLNYGTGFDGTVNGIAINSSGNVGVGTSTPNNAVLEVVQTTASGNTMRVYRNLASGSTDSSMLMIYNDNASDDQDLVYFRNDGTGDLFNVYDATTEVFRILDGGNVGIGDSFTPSNLLHLYVNNSSTNALINIEQDGIGDAALSFNLTGGQNWTIGIDNSDSDSFKISRTADLSSINLLKITSTEITLDSKLYVGNNARIVGSAYFNWGVTEGSGGYGLRDNAGTMEFKNSGGSWTTFSSLINDHGGLSGLSDDDHSQYALLAGRSGGQTLKGGTGTTDDLTLQSTSGVGTTGSDIYFRVGNNGSVLGMTVENDGDIDIGGYSGSSARCKVYTNDSTALQAKSDANSQVGVYGWVTGSTTAIGVYGISTSGSNSYGVYGVSDNYRAIAAYGNASHYDFYAEGPGTNYGPFTGGHETLVKGKNLKKGMIVVCTGIVKNREDSISSTLPEIELCNKINDKNVFGVFNSYTSLGEHHWYKEKENEEFATVNALGEGRVLVTNINDDLEPGDYITTSEIKGHGQKQNDDLLHNYTLGKVTEKVNWNEIKETIEYEGKQYKKYLIACVYTSA